MQARLQGWESYPVSVQRSQADIDDTRQYQNELRRRSGDLFVNDPSAAKLELLESCPARDLKTIPDLKRVGELRDILMKATEAASTRVFLISQLNSWSRLKITEDMFKMVCHFYAISPRFLDLVTGFGKKKASSDEHFMGCYGRLSRGEKAPGFRRVKSFELCYNLRQYELHGRVSEDPWSCRHTAIHQKYYLEDGQSAWIIIQSPKAFRENLEFVLSDLSTRVSFRDEHPFILHIRYLTSSGANLRKYLNYMSEQLTILDMKVSFFKRNKDCDVDFSLSQNLQTIRRKLASALSIIEGTISTVAIISEESEVLQSAAEIEPSLQQAFQRELNYIANDLKSHASTVKKLIGFSEDIRRLNHKILDLLGEKLLHEDGLSLKELAYSDSKDKKRVMEHSDKIYKDSRTMKIATIIAMFYLPANLVMSIFSTGLISYDDSSGGIQVKTQIWIPVLTTVVMAFGTFITATFWDRRGRHKPPFSTDQSLE